MSCLMMVVFLGRANHVDFKIVKMEESKRFDVK